MVYLDNAATTKPSPKVRRILRKATRQCYANTESTYKLGRDNSAKLYEARKDIAKSLNLLPDNIFFTSGGSEGNTWAIKGWATKYQGKLNPRILYSETEHHSVLNAIDFCKEHLGAEAQSYSLTRTGQIDIKKFKSLVKRFHPNFVSFTLVNNEIGCKLDLYEILDYLKKQKDKVWVHIDAVQGFMCQELREPFFTRLTDFIVLSGHKFYAPKGVGFLYARDPKNDLAPLINGGVQEQGLRGGTINLPSILALARAVKDYNPRKVQKRNMALYEYLVYRLKKANVRFMFNGRPDDFTGIINLNLHTNGSEIVSMLDVLGIYVSTGAACDDPEEGSHVLKAMNIESHSGLRVSMGRYTKRRELRRFANNLSKILESMRKLSGVDNVKGDGHGKNRQGHNKKAVNARESRQGNKQETRKINRAGRAYSAPTITTVATVTTVQDEED